MRQRSSVSSLLRYSTWPGPAGQVMIRQKLALVVNGSAPVEDRRINGFSPVRIILFGSAAMGISRFWHGGSGHRRRQADFAGAYTAQRSETAGPLRCPTDYRGSSAVEPQMA